MHLSPNRNVDGNQWKPYTSSLLSVFGAENMESTPVRCAETMHHRKRRDILAYFVVALVTLASVCDGFVVRSVSLPSRRHDLTSIFDAGAAAAVSTETNGGSTRRRRPRHRKDSLRGLKCLTQIPR